MAMAEREGQMHRTQAGSGHPTEAIKNLIHDKAPSTTQALSVAALLPIGGLLLALSGVTLTGTMIGLAVATPLFVIFSPVLVPAAVVIGLAVTGFLASGAFGLTALTSLSWIVNYVRGGTAGNGLPEGMQQVKQRMAEAAGYVGQKTKDVGQGIQNRAQDQQTRT